MSLLDGVLGAVKDLGGNAGQGPLMGHVLELVSGNNLGGLAGLAQKFKDNGMSNIISSWIATGENLPVSPAQIEQVLGAQQVQQLAAKAGIAPGDVMTQLAKMLPDVIDKLTPNGSLPTGGMLEQGIGLLGNSRSALAVQGAILTAGMLPVTTNGEKPCSKNSRSLFCAVTWSIWPSVLSSVRPSARSSARW